MADIPTQKIDQIQVCFCVGTILHYTFSVAPVNYMLCGYVYRCFLLCHHNSTGLFIGQLAQANGPIKFWCNFSNMYNSSAIRMACNNYQKIYIDEWYKVPIVQTKVGPSEVKKYIYIYIYIQGEIHAVSYTGE